jgi:hypothetical protein
LNTYTVFNRPLGKIAALRTHRPPPYPPISAGFVEP